MSLQEKLSGLVHRGLYTRVKYTSSLPQPSLRKCGSRKLSSWYANGYSRGNSSSFQYVGPTSGIGCVGTNLLSMWRFTPPGVPTDAVSTTRRYMHRVICQPHRFP